MGIWSPCTSGKLPARLREEEAEESSLNQLKKLCSSRHVAVYAL